MSEMRQCDELPVFLQNLFQDYIINILDEKELEKILPLCSKKRYNILTENGKQEEVVEYSIMVNEYSETPEIVRITKLWSI